MARPGPKPGFKGTLAERFERMTIPEPNSGCLLWIGGGRTNGYGKIWDGKRQACATHISLLLVGKEVPQGMDALHRCDNPHCVNPDHLFVGDAKINSRDMVAKGRHNFSGLALGRRRRNPNEIDLQFLILRVAGF